MNCLKTTRQKDEAVTDNSEIAKTINSYFTNVVKSLEAPNPENINQFYEKMCILQQNEAKTDTFHIVFSDSDINTIGHQYVGHFIIKSTKSERLTGVTFDDKPIFQFHI